jgi:hypothetical protein
MIRCRGAPRESWCRDIAPCRWFIFPGRRRQLEGHRIVHGTLLKQLLGSVPLQQFQQQQPGRGAALVAGDQALVEPRHETINLLQRQRYASLASVAEQTSQLACDLIIATNQLAAIDLDRLVLVDQTRQFRDRLSPLLCQHALQNKYALTIALAYHDLRLNLPPGRRRGLAGMGELNSEFVEGHFVAQALQQIEEEEPEALAFSAWISANQRLQQ